MPTLTTSDQQEIYYEIDQKGKDCIVFLHGLGGNLSAWKPTRDILQSNGFKTLAIDLRGQGKSSRPGAKTKYTFERLSKDVQEVLEYENIKKCILVGHCYGGVVSIYLANMYPSLIERLILINTTYKKPFENNLFSNKISRNIMNSLAQILPSNWSKNEVNFEKYKGTTDHDPKRICSDILHTSSRSYIYLLNRILNLNAKNKLDAIQCPTLVISGSKDTVYPTKISKDIARFIKNGKLEVVEGENHIIVINNPAKTAELIQDFIK